MLKSLALLVYAAVSPSAIRLELAFVQPAVATPESREAMLGVRLGVEEAVHTGRLFGVEVVLDSSGRGHGAVVVGGFERTRCDSLSRSAVARQFVYVALGCAGQAADSTWTFHLEPAGGAAAVGAVVWHPSLERYGAAQLNARFQERFGRPMTGPAWSGWMAVKVALEGTLRARSGAAGRLRAMLSTPIRFDGHKGAPLAFDAAHRLVQPLYRATGEPEEIRR